MKHLTPIYQHTANGNIWLGELTRSMNSGAWELMGYAVASEAAERLERLLGEAE